MKKILTAVIFIMAIAATQCEASIIPLGVLPYQPPEARAFLKITASSITAAWGPGTNDASSRYECENISASTFLAPSPSALSWESAGLFSGTAYSFRARAWDDNATSATGWTDLGSAYTTGRIKAQGLAISDGDSISAIPDIEFSLTSSVAMDSGSCAVLIDDIPVTDGLSATGKYDNISVASGTVTISYSPKTGLSGNPKKISVEIRDINSTLYTETVSGLQVKSSSDTGFRMTSSALCYPNPYDPKNGDLKTAYHLSSDGNINIYILDAVGRTILKRSVPAGENGARYGYNEILWNGKNAYGETAVNDVYVICIADGSGNILGKTRVMVLR